VRLLLWLFNRIGMSINESEQLYPERSTTAFAIYYPVAKYFSTEELFFSYMSLGRWQIMLSSGIFYVLLILNSDYPRRVSCFQEMMFPKENGSQSFFLQSQIELEMIVRTTGGTLYKLLKLMTRRMDTLHI
jgi:hypothetical protein